MVVRVGAQPLPGLGDRDQPGDDEILAELPVAFQGPMAGPWAVRSITAGSALVVSYSDGVRTAAREYGDEGGYLPAEYIHRPGRVTPAKNLITTRSQKMRRAMPGTPWYYSGSRRWFSARSGECRCDGSRLFMARVYPTEPLEPGEIAVE